MPCRLCHPGEYRVAVSLDGFSTVVQERVIVDGLAVVGLNVVLEVGAVTQEVTVLAAPPPLGTADGRLGQTVRNEVYTALPLVMNTGGPRDPTQFMFLMPGVQSVGRWGNVMGGQDFTDDQYVEGLPITNSVVQGEGRNLSYGISVEAVDQFQVETSGTAAMYNGQGVSNYVVKSGTNQFRFTAFEFMRNTGLDTKSFFAATKPEDDQHEYGVTVGGPIRRNRVFFFTVYDGYRDRRQTDSRLISVPTAAMRNGDFSALPVAIYDPLTTRPNPNGTGFVRDPFPGNVIPAHRISTVSRYFQSFLPEPTGAGIQNNYLGGSLPTGFNNDNITTKVDLNLSAKQQASVLVGLRRAAPGDALSRSARNAQTALPLPYTETRLVEEVTTTAQVKHTYVMSSSLVNQFSLGFARVAVPIANATIDGRYPQQAGLTGLPPGEADSSFPEVAFAGPNAPTQWRGTDARAFTEYLNNYTLQNNVQWMKGRHAMTFGFQAQRMDANERERTYGSLATFGFSNSQTAGFSGTGTLLANTGNAYASFLLGDLNATTVIEDSDVATSGRFSNVAFWVQDDFKVTPDLALNLGLRYDVMEPYTEVYDRWSFMNPDLPNAAASGYPGAMQFAGFGENSCMCRTPIDTYYGAVGPRLGAAYSVSKSLVLRGAYGIMYSRRGAVGGRAGARNGTGLLGYSANASFPSANGFAPAYNWTNGRPGLSGSAVLRSDVERRIHDHEAHRRRRHLRRSRDWGPTAALPELERGLPVRAHVADDGRSRLCGQQGRLSRRRGTRLLREPARPALSASGEPADADGQRGQPRGRAGHRPRHRSALRELRGHHRSDAASLPAVPSGVTDVYGNVARSNYHSLQLTLEQRRLNGLVVNVNYTYSRTTDNLAARTGCDMEQDWAVGANNQPHVLNGIVVYDLPFGGEGRWGSDERVRARARQRLADLQHHAVPIGTAARPVRRRVQPAERGHLLCGLQRRLLRARTDQRRLG